MPEPTTADTAAELRAALAAAVDARARAAVLGLDYARLRSTTWRAAGWTAGLAWGLGLVLFVLGVLTFVPLVDPKAMPAVIATMLLGLILGLMAAIVHLLAGSVAFWLALARLLTVPRQILATLVGNVAAVVTILVALTIWPDNGPIVFGLVVGFAAGVGFASFHELGLLLALALGTPDLRGIGVQLRESGSRQTVAGYAVRPLLAQRAASMLLRIAVALTLGYSQNVALGLLLAVGVSAVDAWSFVEGRRDHIARAVAIETGAAVLLAIAWYFLLAEG